MTNVRINANGVPVMTKSNAVERETNTHCYFWGGIYSQWYKTHFVGNVCGDLLKFTSAEQYMMAAKALHFCDYETFDFIMSTNDPARQKAAGRQVKNFDETVWYRFKLRYVTHGNIYKFAQNEVIRNVLLNEHRDKVIVEASPQDKVWGIGLHYSDDDVLDEAKWRGQNLLGTAIMNARTWLIENGY